MSHASTAGTTPVASGAAAGAVLGRSSRPGWRGRTRAWKAVLSLLRAADESRGGVLLVEGGSGMGKSRMLGDAIEAAAYRGFMLAHGAADEPSRLAPLVPLMMALGESPHTLPREVPSPSSDTTDIRLRLIERLQTRLEERVSRGPLLIALDDLQWADPTTVLALRSLIPELASYPLVWLLSRTTGGAVTGVEGLYEVLERDGATRSVLDPLSDRAVAEIVTDELGAPPGPELLALTAATGGNPFMLMELIEGLADEDAVTIEDGQARLVSLRLPRRVQELARERLGRLSPHTRHLLQVAGVLGRSFRVDDLAEMFDEPASRLLPAIEEAETAGVVVPAGEQLMFRHDLLWRAVTETVTMPVRQALHRQAAEMLLRHSDSAIPAAAHLMHYARPGDARALGGLDQAVNEVLPTSPQSAADLAVRALELTAPGDPRRFDRTVTAVFTLTTSGRLSEATEFARTAMAQVPRPDQAARLRYELAYALLLIGRPVDAAAEVEEALAEPDLPAELRGPAEQVFFRALNASHDLKRGQALAESIVASPADHSRATQVGARMLLSYRAWADGSAREGIDHAHQAIRIASCDDVQAPRVHPRLQLAFNLTDLRELGDADAQLQRATEEITEFGHTAYAPCPAIFRARLRLAEGRLDDAATEAQAGLALADEMGMHAFILVGLGVLIIVNLRRGDVDTAAGWARRYAERYEAGVLFGRAWGRWAEALLAEARDGPRKALDVLHVPYTDPDERRWLFMAEPDCAAWLTRTALAAGDRAGAEVVAATAGELARDNPGIATLAASAAHARGILHADRTALRRAASTRPGPWGRASAAEDLGVLLAREDAGPGTSGESGGSGGSGNDAAIRALDEALEGYQRTGALRDAARIRARLRRLGVRRRHWTQSERPDSGWDSLTDTERNVAELVAHGLTNPQVAAQMFVSPHTVKFHLRQVFRKLGIGSRVELARLATEHTADLPES